MASWSGLRSRDLIFLLILLVLASSLRYTQARSPAPASFRLRYRRRRDTPRRTDHFHSILSQIPDCPACGLLEHLVFIARADDISAFCHARNVVVSISSARPWGLAIIGRSRCNDNNVRLLCKGKHVQRKTQSSGQGIHSGIYFRSVFRMLSD